MTRFKFCGKVRGVHRSMIRRSCIAKLRHFHEYIKAFSNYFSLGILALENFGISKGAHVCVQGQPGFFSYC